MKVWIIKESHMGGSMLLSVAYTDKRTCELVCQEKAGEWVSYIPVGCEGEELPENRIIVGNTVYTLIRTNKNTYVAKKIVSRLSEEEFMALKEYINSLSS